MTRIVSLCSGYGGLDLAAEALLDGDTVLHVEFDAEPSKVLAARWPGVPNLGDLTQLEWADTDAEVLTAGYPCQPFSGAGKRLGTDDPRHLFPWIARGMERMRPELALFENVRNHLNLGFDVVLAELDRIDYDVRWVLLPASAVGAPHGRSRLWIACRDRRKGGWPAPTGQPSALADGDGGWITPQGGLFGDTPADTPGTAGTMVDGVRWDTDAAVMLAAGPLQPPWQERALLGTPRVTTSGMGVSHAAVERGETHSRLENQVALLPTPRTTDTNGAGAHGDGGMDLRTTVSLLPTPTSADSNSSGGSVPEAVTLTDAVVRTELGTRPNPRHNSPALRAIEQRALGAAEQMLPTPTARLAGSGAESAWRDRPTFSNGFPDLHTAVAHGLGAEGAGEPDQLLPTPRATDGSKGGPNQAGSSGDLMLPSAVQPDRWGPYAAAVARWEALTRPAPSPTEPGRSGAPRLSPRFVEWMQGLPDGWVTDLLGRNPALKALGNGVVPQQAHAAFSLLLADLLALREAA